MNNENFFFYIKVRTALNMQPKFIDDELYSAFYDQDLSYNTVAKWSRYFREDIQDQARLVTENNNLNILKKFVVSFI